jgi:gamma-glutamyl hercynylcysteine S-oxide synthase
MDIIGKTILLLSAVWITSPFSVNAQSLRNLEISNETGLTAKSIMLSDSSIIIFSEKKPLYSFCINNKLFTSVDVSSAKNGDKYLQIFHNNLRVTYSVSDTSSSGWESVLVFENSGKDTVSISNVVPFGENISSVCITGRGNADSVSACLFRPGFSPVRVILPDNAWESGYSSFYMGQDYSVCALARRINSVGGKILNYQTVLPPGSKVFYSFYADIFKGEWQNGLHIMFRDKYLHDIANFDNTLYKRADLAWIKDCYLIVLKMIWDREFYDRSTGKFTYAETIKQGIDRFGNIDVFGLCTAPAYGFDLDHKSQTDLYKNMPGGMDQLKAFVKMSHLSGTRFFIDYNSRDSSTKKEDYYKEIVQLVTETEADGVILSTKGYSGGVLQASVDSLKKGVIIYSGEMSIPNEMPGIVSGRVQNSILMSPELNLNKLIKPDFSIFRVCDIAKDVIHREIAISFFNGYGTELNMFSPGGRNDAFRADMDFLSHTTFILRQNNDAFLDNDWTPLVETTLDSVFVNRWKSGEKTIFTVLNMRSEGFDRSLFKVNDPEGKHYISLWNHENLLPVIEKGTTFIGSKAIGWQSSYSGTRKEGSVDCIAELPDLIKSRIIGDSIKVSKTGKGKLMIWKGNPSFQTEHKDFVIINDTTIRIKDIFGFNEGKMVLQLIENQRLVDENVLDIKGGEPWIISNVTPSERAATIPRDMVLVPGAKFSLMVTSDESIIPYPHVNGNDVQVDSFLIDKYPVTNAQYYEFMINSLYNPSDTARFLKHWESGIYKQGQEKYPVVYLSYEDMQAYAKWAGKRLPTQAEWQLAAQGTDTIKWPWGNEFHGTYCNNSFNRSTPVDAFPKGQSRYGVLDLVGNVWQMTNDMYFNGTNYFVVIRGGSYYKSESKLSNLRGGPQQLDKTQIMLLVSPGFDRSSTVGFRCAKDINSKYFKGKR